MYERGPTDAELEAVGMTRDDIESAQGDTVVWQEHRVVTEVFSALNTQWRTSMTGAATGLDYAAVLPVLDLMGIPQADRLPLFNDLRVMESEALVAMNED